MLRGNFVDGADQLIDQMAVALDRQRTVLVRHETPPHLLETGLVGLAITGKQRRAPLRLAAIEQCDRSLGHGKPVDDLSFLAQRLHGANVSPRVGKSKRMLFNALAR